MKDLWFDRNITMFTEHLGNIFGQFDKNLLNALHVSIVLEMIV